MSTGLVLGVVGAVVGAPFGLSQVGFAVGSTLGNIIDAPDGPSPGDLSAPQIQEGHQLIRPYGTVQLTCHPVSVSEYTATANDTGGKGGPPEGSAGYTYTIDALCVIAQRVPSMPLIAVTRVWVNKKLVETRLASSTSGSLAASAATEAYTSLILYPGGSSQNPPPEYETRVGTANASAYRNVATVEIIGLVCGGSPTLPLVEVEVITAGTPATGLANCVLQANFVSDASDSSYYNTTPTVTGSWTYGGVLSTGIDNANKAVVWGDADMAIRSETGFTLQTRFTLRDMTFGDSGAGQNIILRMDWVSGGPGYALSLAAYRDFFGVLYLIASDGATEYWRIGVTQDDHHHVAFVVSAGSSPTLTIYLDGVSEYSGAFLDLPSTSTSVRTEMYSTFGTRGWELEWVDFWMLPLYSTNFSPPTEPDAPDAPIGSWTPGTVDLQDIVDAELATNDAISAADHDTTDLAGVTVRGFKATGPCGKTIAELGDIFYYDLVPSRPLRYQRRGSATVATILNADTGAGVGEAGEPFTGLKIGNDVERPSVVGLSAPNASADHEPVFRRGDRLNTEGPDIRKVRTEVELTPAEVQGRSLAMTLMERASSHTAEFGLSDKYAVAEPGDVYSVYDDQGNLYSLFPRSMTYSDGVKQARWELNDTSALIETGITDGNYTPSLIVVAPVDSNLVSIDGPILQDADDDPGAYTAIEGEGTATYPGGVVRRSVDDLDFTEIAATHPTESVVGVATSALGDWTGGYVWDELNSVTVVIGEGQSLASSTEAAMQANRAINTAYLGAHGRWEVIRYRTATLGAALTYTLTGLLRGMRGTERHMDAHIAGDTFVLATAAGLRRMTGEVSTIGQLRYLKAVTNGRPAASATSVEFTNTAEGLRPFSPTDLMASRDGSANITFTIRHRPRLFPRYGGAGGSYIPPSSGAFELDVYSTSGYTTVLRTLTSTDGTFSYSAANQTTDFGSTQATVYTESFEVSPTYGRGSALRASA